MTKHLTDLVHFRETLSQDLGPYDDTLMNQEGLDKWKALHFLNGAEVAHAAGGDYEYFDHEDLLSNASALNTLRQRVESDDDDIIELLASVETVFARLEVMRNHPELQGYRNATVEEQERYFVFTGLAKVLKSRTS